jgi:hypothetical protein
MASDWCKYPVFIGNRVPLQTLFDYLCHDVILSGYISFEKLH